MIDLAQPGGAIVEVPVGSAAAAPAGALADPHAAQLNAHRRLLFGIELTLFAGVLLLAAPGSAGIAILVASLGLLIALSGL